MRDVLHYFVRRDDGSWECVAAAELQLPSGRIQVAAGARFERGGRFMGIDMVEYLEAQSRAGNGRYFSD